MFIENTIQRWTVINDHVIGSEVGFGDVTAVTSAKHKDLVVAS